MTSWSQQRQNIVKERNLRKYAPYSVARLSTFSTTSFWKGVKWLWYHLNFGKTQNFEKKNKFKNLDSLPTPVTRLQTVFKEICPRSWQTNTCPKQKHLSSKVKLYTNLYQLTRELWTHQNKHRYFHLWQRHPSIGTSISWLWIACQKHSNVKIIPTWRCHCQTL